jgi:LysM repeat protein
MTGRGSSRFVAPLALAAALVGVLAVVQTSRSDHAKPARPAATHVRRHHHHKPRPRVYAIRPGDTLTMIATRTGTTVDVLEQLNPGIDPQALHAGARLKLSR